MEKERRVEEMKGGELRVVGGGRVGWWVLGMVRMCLWMGWIWVGMEENMI